MEEFHKGSFLSSFIRQHIGQLVSNVFYKPGFRHVLPDEVGDSRDICRDQSARMAPSSQGPHSKGQSFPTFPFAHASEAYHLPIHDTVSDVSAILQVHPDLILERWRKRKDWVSVTFTSPNLGTV